MSKIIVLYPFPLLSRTSSNTTVSPASMTSYEVRTEWKAIVSEIEIIMFIQYSYNCLQTLKYYLTIFFENILSLLKVYSSKNLMSDLDRSKFFLFWEYFSRKATVLFKLFKKVLLLPKKYLRFGEALPSSRAVTLASKLTSVACKPVGKLYYISIFIHLVQ